jgi:hypothetical protein
MLELNRHSTLRLMEQFLINLAQEQFYPVETRRSSDAWCTHTP